MTGSMQHVRNVTDVWRIVACLLPGRAEEETGRRWMGRDAAPRPDDTPEALL